MEMSQASQNLSKFQDDIDALECHSRRLNLEIHEVPETEAENFLSKVNETAQWLDIECLSEGDVVAIHRLPTWLGRRRRIIARFARLELRNAWLAKKRSLRDSSIKLFIAENMATRSRKLLAAAKEWVKHSGYKYA